MATKTLGSTLTTSLTALAYLPGTGSLAPADVAALNNAIKDDKGNAHLLVGGAFSSSGQLVIPNRGILQVLPGDWVGVDANGWPILVSAQAIAAGGWTHS